MANSAGMVGMGNQMVPPYGATMQNQMTNMGMGPQVNQITLLFIFLVLIYNPMNGSYSFKDLVCGNTKNTTNMVTILLRLILK